MKKFGAILFVAGLVPAMFAQTNDSVDQANAPIQFPPVLLGQTNAPVVRPMSLQDCIAAAVEHNFDVRIERFEPLKAQLSVEAAYAGYDPIFRAAGTHTFNESGTLFQNGLSVPPQITDANSLSSSLSGVLPSGLQYNIGGNIAESYGSVGGNPPFDTTGGNVGITLDQPLLKNLWIDSTRLQVTAAKNQMKFTQQSLRQQLITTISAVESAYYELIYDRENVNVQQEALNLALTQLDQDNQRVKIGSVAERAGTLEQDEAQVAQNKSSLILALSQLGTQERALKILITDRYSDAIFQDIQPTTPLEATLQVFDLQDSWNKGLTQRPDFLQAKINVEQEGIQLKFDRNQLFPQLDLTGSYGFNGAGKEYSDALGQVNEGNRPFYSYGGRLTVPLDNLAARTQYKSDKAVEAQDLLKLKQLEQTIMVQIDNAIGTARSDYANLEYTKQARVSAQAALDAEQKKYAVGKSTTFDVLQLQNKLTAAKSAEIRAVATYEEDLVNLAQTEGSTLERRNVDVTTK